MLRSRANALRRAFRISVRHGQQAGGAGPIVVRAVVDVVAVRQRRAQADVIQMRADDHVFVFQHRVAAFENADHVLAVIRLRSSAASFRLIFLRRVQLERILLGVRPGAIENLLRVRLSRPGTCALVSSSPAVIAGTAGHAGVEPAASARGKSGPFSAAPPPGRRIRRRSDSPCCVSCWKFGTVITASAPFFAAAYCSGVMKSLQALAQRIRAPRPPPPAPPPRPPLPVAPRVPAAVPRPPRSCLSHRCPDTDRYFVLLMM